MLANFNIFENTRCGLSLNQAKNLNEANLSKRVAKVVLINIMQPLFQSDKLTSAAEKEKKTHFLSANPIMLKTSFK